MTESVLLTTTRLTTFDGDRVLTGATGFFFEREERLFLVTSRHVFIDTPTKHFPNRIEIEIHTDGVNLTGVYALSLWLYADGKSQWRQGADSGGEIDVAAIEIPRSALPSPSAFVAFQPEHLQPSLDKIEVGSAVLVVGFPLGFHDVIHHLPVVRHAVISSAFGVRFQGHGVFLTDARTHRGTSGAPVVISDPGGNQRLPWMLLGVHSSRLDMGTRDLELDESLGLNCVWYADILLTLTSPLAATGTDGIAASP